MSNSLIALIPARSGSKRVPQKNIRNINGHPIIAYTIAAARQSAIFDSIVVSTDCQEIAEISRYYGAEVPFLRPREYAEDSSPDIEWIEYTLSRLARDGEEYHFFSILRPTSPFRLPQTIRRAWQAFLSAQGADSLRAVEKCSQHPAKMWRIEGERMKPIMQNPDPSGTPWHSTPYQALPSIYVQNASLEIARSDVVSKSRTISGTEIVPFITEGFEGFDINTDSDWQLLESLLRDAGAKLPVVMEPEYGSGIVKPHSKITSVRSI